MPRLSDRQPPFFDQFQIHCGSLNLAESILLRAQIVRPAKLDQLSAGNSLISRGLLPGKHAIEFL